MANRLRRDVNRTVGAALSWGGGATTAWHHE